MQDDPTTDNTDNQTQELLIERDDWLVALEPYEGHAYAALRLGFNIAMLRQELDTQMFKSRPVIEALDLAMEVLFPFTDFHQASFDLFIRLTDGKLTFQEEQMLNALGVKF
jgi:hypothetical protein